MALQSEHLSTYEVIYEEDTALYQQMRAGEFAVDEDLACDMYEDFVEAATRAGFQQYEVANFAKPRRASSSAPEPEARLADSGARPVRAATYRCEHNVNYWRGGDFYGVGPSATGYVRGVRTRNCSNTQLYCERLESNTRAIESSEALPPDAKAGETAAFGLRMVDGWPFHEFQAVTGMDLRRDWREEMSELVSRGWGVLTPESFRLTPRGLRFADSAAELFLR